MVSDYYYLEVMLSSNLNLLPSEITTRNKLQYHVNDIARVAGSGSRQYSLQAALPASILAALEALLPKNMPTTVEYETRDKPPIVDRIFENAAYHSLSAFSGVVRNQFIHSLA